jgi:Fe-S-cluster-containing dehydrogenase component/CRP-like cAMP-binding protein
MNTTSIKRPQRWDIPFWRELTGDSCLEISSGEVTRLLSEVPLFRDMDTSRFPESASLRDILMNDARIRHFKKGDIVVRQGDYGSSAFLILKGQLKVVLEHLDETLIGRKAPQKKSLFTALAQLWSNPSQPEVRDLEGKTSQRIASTEKHDTIFLQDVTALIQHKRTAILKEGEFFGEIAALGRTPRTSTVVSDTDAVLLEMRWQGLREIRLRSPEFKENVDRLYRERSLKSHLRETPIFRHLDDTDLDKVAEATQFLTFGNFDWHGSYSKLREASSADRMKDEPIVAQEGHYANGVYLVRSGFARLSESYNHGELTVSYLGRGQSFGLEEVAHNWKEKTQLPFQRSLRALGYVDVLFVPTSILEQVVLPLMPEDLMPASVRGKTAGAGTEGADRDTVIQPEMMEFLVERRFINGTATMLIDMDRCTRCDDCVRACASAHDNNPRFVRHGPINGNFMVANACMHCQDPVCMIGCPTGAIHRDSAQGRVTINDQTCIGCATCANSCPYDNIQMVTARRADGTPFYDQATHQPIQKAAKCDLCGDQVTGPACANACPHDAMVRIDMRDTNRLAKWTQQR